MTDALATLFSRFPGVESAYLGWKVTPSSGDESYLLVIVGALGTREVVNHDLGRELAPFSQEHPVDVMHVPPGTDHLLSGIDPFYRAR